MTDGVQQPAGPATECTESATAEPVTYELCNVFGTPTGRRIVLAKGEPLPSAPKGWFWKPAPR